MKAAAQCFGCGQDFDSKGPRCCSAKCERAYLDRQDAVQAMAEVGMEAPSKRFVATADSCIMRRAEF